MRRVIVLSFAFILSIGVYAQTEGLYVTNGGKVGIGTDSPNCWFGGSPLLHIYGTRPTLSFTPSSINGLATIQWKGLSTGSEFHLNYYDGDNSKLILNSYQAEGGNLPVFSILGSGNIGIGTNTPYNPLTIQRISGGSGVSGSDGKGGVRVCWSSGYGVSLDAWDGPSPRWGITKYSGNTPKVMIEGSYNSNDVIFNSGGKVGIGTSSPNAKLEVNGNLRIASDGTYVGPGLDFRFFSGETAVSDIRNYLSGDRRNIEFSNGWGAWRFVAAGDFNIVNWNGQYYNALFIESTTGTVCIGTTQAPSDCKLAVKGNVRAENFWVTNVTNWPDFVFAPTYKLRTLAEVEQFVKENKHLPDVPSKTQVEEHGVSLGEMNAILLQKIEELTLYNIEQEKALQLQNTKNETLEYRIEKLEALINKLIK